MSSHKNVMRFTWNQDFKKSNIVPVVIFTLEVAYAVLEEIVEMNSQVRFLQEMF